MPDKTELDPEDIRVGATIRVIRQSARMSGADLASAIGISEPMVSAIERGTRRATPQVCRDIAEALRVPPAAIIAQTDTETAA